MSTRGPSIRSTIALAAVALLMACGRSRAVQLELTATPGAPAAASPAPTAARSSAPPEAIAWVKDHAIPVATTKPGSGFADLQPLRQVVGDARIVSLGEATHGTHEFFEMKARLLEFLVTEMGLTPSPSRPRGPSPTSSTTTSRPAKATPDNSWPASTSGPGTPKKCST